MGKHEVPEDHLKVPEEVWLQAELEMTLRIQRFIAGQTVLVRHEGVNYHLECPDVDKVVADFHFPRNESEKVTWS